MKRGSVNTSASVAAALFAGASLVLTIWLAGEDARKTSRFRDDCRSAVGAEMLLLDPTTRLLSLNPAERDELQLRWIHGRARLEALKAIASASVPGDFRVFDGLTDAIFASNEWANSTGYFWSVSLQNAAGVHEGDIRTAVERSRGMLERAAGEIR